MGKYIFFLFADVADLSRQRLLERDWDTLALVHREGGQPGLGPGQRRSVVGGREEVPKRLHRGQLTPERKHRNRRSAWTTQHILDTRRTRHARHARHTKREGVPSSREGGAMTMSSVLRSQSTLSRWPSRGGWPVGESPNARRLIKPMRRRAAATDV